MVKITVLYGHPTNPETFEKYYAQTHLPLTARMKGVTRLELTKFLAAPDGGKPSSYRMAGTVLSQPKRDGEDACFSRGANHHC